MGERHRDQAKFAPLGSVYANLEIERSPVIHICGFPDPMGFRVEKGADRETHSISHLPNFADKYKLQPFYPCKGLNEPTLTDGKNVYCLKSDGSPEHLFGDLGEMLGEFGVGDLYVGSREMSKMLDALLDVTTGKNPSLSDLCVAAENGFSSTLAPLLSMYQNCLWGYDEHFQALLLGAILENVGAGDEILACFKLKMLPLGVPQARNKLRHLLVKFGSEAQLHEIARNGVKWIKMTEQVESLVRVCNVGFNSLAVKAATWLQKHSK